MDLDAEELFHLAMKASNEGDADKAIRYYKQSIEQDERGETCYLLGAEYADLQMYDRAIEAMSRAVSINPALYTTYFQLCLLHLIMNHQTAAKEVLQPLLSLEESTYLRRFGDGLLAMIDDRPEEARVAFIEGMAANTENPALNGDVRKLLDRLGASSEAENGSSVEEGAEKAMDNDAASQFLISKYQKNTQ